MGSLLERLEARERAAAERIEELREQIAALTEQLGEAEQDVERLQIGRSVLAEVLAEDDRPEATVPPVVPAGC